MKKSTLALTALPVLRSTAVAIISVSPNFIWTCVYFEFQILLLLCSLFSDYKPECDIGLDPDPQAEPRPGEVCRTAEHRGLRQT